MTTMLAALQRATSTECVRDTPSGAFAEPASPEDASALLALCSAEGWKVRLMGAGTWPQARAMSDATRHFDVTVTTRALRGVNDYEPEDLTVSVAAGTTMDELDTALRANNQWLALDPPALPGATIGALVATASAGPMRTRYGTPRDQVLGVDIITGDGRALHFGGNVVKNVAGYDITRPIVGSNGALGLITRVSLRLRPLPALDQTFAVGVADIEQGLMLSHVIDNAWPVAALEIVSSTDAQDAPWTVLVRIHGHAAEIQDAEQRLARAVQSESPSSRLAQVAGSSATWRRLAETEAAAANYVRLAAKVTDLPHTTRIAKRLADHALGRSPGMAVHAATGIVRVWGTAESANLHDAVETAGEEMLSVDGTVIWSSVAHPSEPATSRRRQIEAGIRSIFDPAGILSESAL